MTENDLAVFGVVAQHVGRDEVDGCTACFVRVVVCWLRKESVHKARVHRVCRVDEDNCFAAVEEVPYWCESFVA